MSSDDLIARLSPENQILARAHDQAAAYEQRLKRQREIIERYDTFRKWVLTVLVPEMRVWAEELVSVDQPVAASVIREWADDVHQRGENPQ